jgi:60 kDa SS-A/Ro ribonucleoprotein
MSKFNVRKQDTTKTVNHEGGQAFKSTAKRELCSLVCTSILKDVFYEKADERLDRLKKLIKKVVNEDGGALFVAKLASFARNELNLRTIPLILMVELAIVHNGDDIVKRTANAVINRADEIAEALAYWKHTLKLEALGKRAISKQLRLGLADAFHKFDEYQFSKYKGKGNIVSLRDAMFIVHPKPRDKEQEALFNRIASDTLAVADTWETKISATKGDENLKKEAWEKLITEKKLGYMATLRNLRNFVKIGISKDAMIMVADYISNEKAVLNSKQLPYRFLSAYRAMRADGIAKSHLFVSALEKAMVISASNIDCFDEKEDVMISCDVSGSMTCGRISDDITYADLGLTLGVTLSNRLKFCDFGVFGENTKMITDLPKTSILESVETLRDYGNIVGHSTNGYKVVRDARLAEKKYDRIVLFTDCELWGGSVVDEWRAYKKDVNPNAKLVIFNLAGYGTTPIKMNALDTLTVDGWSDKIFKAIDMIENETNLLAHIESVEI